MGQEDIQNSAYKRLLLNTVKWLTKEKSNPKILLLNDNGIPSWSTPKPDYISILQNVLNEIADTTISSQTWFNFDGSELPGDYDLIIPGGAYNWWQGVSMPVNGQQAIVNFVSNGGALLTQEWIYWRIAVSPNSFTFLEPILPADSVAPWTTISSLSWLEVNYNSIISNNIPSEYSWNAADVDGTITFIDSVKDNATIFYDFVSTTLDLAPGDAQCIDVDTYNANKDNYKFISGPYSTDYCDYRCNSFPTTPTPETTPTPTPLPEPTMYFNGAEDNCWENLNNWWYDSDHTQQALSLPSSVDNVLISSSVITCEITFPVVANLVIIDSNLGLDMTVTGIAIFNGSSSSGFSIIGDCIFNDSSYNDGEITGDVIFNDNSRNNSSGNIYGSATFNDSSCNDGGSAYTFIPDPPPSC